ncbi:MAG TPA: type II secretion system protein N [Burkholderiaceae bacterium]
MRTVLWSLAALLCVALTALVFFPASWLTYKVEQETGGRLTLGDPQGTLWRGSAFIGVAPGKGDPVTPLLPGRFSWRLSPMALFGQVDMELENPESLSQPLKIVGTWSQWQVSGASVNLPADRLAGLGAPLNTIQPSGRMQFSWGPLLVAQHGATVAVNGSTSLELSDMSSRLSNIKPLGAYHVSIQWSGESAHLELKTTSGPMLLSGQGDLNNGQFHFSGQAEAEAGQEQKLAGLLNLLGQRQRIGDKDVFALRL